MTALNVRNLSIVCFTVKALESLERADIHGIHVSVGKYAATVGADVNKVESRDSRVTSAVL